MSSVRSDLTPSFIRPWKEELYLERIIILSWKTKKRHPNKVQSLFAHTYTLLNLRSSNTLETAAFTIPLIPNLVNKHIPGRLVWQQLFCFTAIVFKAVRCKIFKICTFLALNYSSKVSKARYWIFHFAPKMVFFFVLLSSSKTVQGKTATIIGFFITNYN